MTYQPEPLASYFNEYGLREWDRLIATPAAEISLYLHAHYLKMYIQPGMRVLEIGAGPGRFTQLLSDAGARIVVADLSTVQLDLNRRFSQEKGFAHAVEEWREADLSDLAPWPADSFDSIVAYGGPFSYVLERRHTALDACLRVLKPDGMLLASVMTLWGSAHNALPGVLALPAEWNQRVTQTGDLTAETFPGRAGNFMHLFRASEARSWLEAAGLEVRAMSASGVLANAWGGNALNTIRQDAGKWAELLRMELEASAEPGCLDMGTHLIFTAQKRSIQ